MFLPMINISIGSLLNVILIYNILIDLLKM